jgi:PKD repeat protein
MYRGVTMAHDRLRASVLILVIVLLVFAGASLAAVPVSGASSLTLEITIFRVRLSLGESIGSSDGVDNWHYYVYVYDGKDIISVSNSDPVGDRSDWMANTTHSFSISTATPSIVIQLLEDEPRSREAVADISGYVGGGIDVLRRKVPRGAEFHATYDLRTNNLNGDRIELENGYLKTSGDYDGSLSGDLKERDENDADLWFRISDNYEPPTATATINAGNVGPIHIGDRVDFDGSPSKASEGSSLTKYQWDFESDGTIDVEGERASHTYSREGGFTATLMVTDSLEESSTCTVEVVVTSNQLPPTPSFTFYPPTPTVKDIINFTDTSTVVGSIQAWLWDFGDGNSSTLRNPSHQFSVADNYTISLTITESSGPLGTLSKRISVKPTPQPDSPMTPSQPEQPTVEEPTYSPDVESSIEGTGRLQVASGIVLAGLLAAVSFLLVVRRP